MCLGLDIITLLLLLLWMVDGFFFLEESIKYEFNTFFCLLFLWAIMIDFALFIFLIKSLSFDYKIFFSYLSLIVGGIAIVGNLLFSEPFKMSSLLEVLIIIMLIIIIINLLTTSIYRYHQPSHHKNIKNINSIIHSWNSIFTESIY